ncbi:MAG: protein kinase [Myxococcales bacterium]|nr:protein kinase [Myxococcales bacterium]
MSSVGPALDLTVLGEIASGGMGAVELARLTDPDGERFVAVKRMHPEYSRDPEFVRMFKDEIWLTGSLSHPNVVGLVGWGEDDGGPYLVMDYIEGVALARIVGGGRRAGEPITAELAAYVAARCAEGLHAAHSLRDDAGRALDIVHRDVTPSNILVGFDGSVKLTDFGIAKATGKSSQTRTGIIKGKIAYMSPEYALRRAVDGRADLYSLGIVMYELAAGRVPFAAKGDLELLKLVAYANAPSLRSVAPEVDAEYAGIVDRLLSKDPADRFASGSDLSAALDDWLAGRGRSADDLIGELREYAGRHAGTARHKLEQMLDEDPSTLSGPGDSPERPRFETRTFTLFRQPPARERAPRPAREDDRPRTRRVAVSGYPPPPSEPQAATPPERTLDPVGRPSHPPPPSITKSRQSSAVLGGVIAGSVAALLLVVISVLAAGRKPPEPAPAAVLPPLPTIEGRTVEPLPAPVESLPVEAAPPPPMAPSLARVQKERPPTGKIKGTPAKVAGPSKGTRPCTPDSFDYPACLKR